MYAYSPFRYPGGKARVANFIKVLCIRNGLVGGHYVEPYAGGASVALALLYAEIANVVHINDVDPGLMAFWTSVLNETDKLCERIAAVPLTVTEWRRQRARQRDDAADPFDRGFATFYLNRTNRSGIIGSGGVIGGLRQTGKWKIDARFPREELIRRIRRIAMYRDRIRLTQQDAIAFLAGTVPDLPPASLVYLDPPYFEKGQGLYPNYYGPDDHEAVAEKVAELQLPWVVSYDNVETIRALYAGRQAVEYGLRYTAQQRYRGREVMFFSDELGVPEVDNPARIDGKEYCRLLKAS